MTKADGEPSAFVILPRPSYLTVALVRSSAM